jgi:hypothetical protein
VISGVKEVPAAELGVEPCHRQIGPIWKLDAQVCGCILPIDHDSDHECSCGSWWSSAPKR